MAIKIGITGGIGSGKSVVSRLLGLMGIPVYLSDLEAKRLMVSDGVIRGELISLLGSEVYKRDKLNKTLLASYVFGSSENADRVNRLVHPRVKHDFRQWIKRQASAQIVSIESAILLEAGFRKEVDVVVMIYAPLDIRVERVVERDASSRELVEKRVHSQMDDVEKCRQADFVMVNDGQIPLMPQVLQLISRLSENISYLCPPNQ